MKLTLLVLLSLLSLPAWAEEKTVLANEHSVFFGIAQQQLYLENVEMQCPAQRLCMGEYFRWTIKINQQVSGPTLPHIVKAAMLQHAKYIYARKQVAMYVLAKIEDPERRKLLGVDYYIEEYVPPHVVYCFEDKSADYGLGQAESVTPAVGTGCYAQKGSGAI